MGYSLYFLMFKAVSDLYPDAKLHILHSIAGGKFCELRNLGEPLTELGLIAGEESQYGLYVTTVDGETLDYNTDGMYWAFYVDGDYASTGVDTTPITEGATYALTATKG